MQQKKTLQCCMQYDILDKLKWEWRIKLLINALFFMLNWIDWILNVTIMVTSQIEISIQMRCKLKFQHFFSSSFSAFFFILNIKCNFEIKCKEMLLLVFWLIYTKKIHVNLYAFAIYWHIVITKCTLSLLSGDAIRTESGVCMIYTWKDW